MVQPSIADQRAVTAPLPTRLKKSDTKASCLKRSDSLRSDDKRHSSSSNNSHQQKTFRHTSMRVQTHANHTTLKRSSSKAAIDSLEEDEEGDQNEGMDSTGGSGLGRGKWIEDVEKQHIHEPFAPIGSAQAPTAPMDAAPRLIADLQLTDVVPSQELTSSSPNTASNRSSAAPVAARITVKYWVQAIRVGVSAIVPVHFRSRRTSSIPHPVRLWLILRKMKRKT